MEVLPFASQLTSSALRPIQDRPPVLMSAIHHRESSQTWPGVSSGGHRIHNMPLNQHSGHLCQHTTGDRSRMTGDCNQTPVTANKWRLWQLSRLEMRAMPQRVMSPFITHRTRLLILQFLSTGWRLVFRDYLSHVDRCEEQLVVPSRSFLPKAQAEGQSWASLQYPGSFMFEIIFLHACNYLFLCVCCCGCNPPEASLSY